MKKKFFKSFSGMRRRHQIQKKKKNRVDFRPVRVLSIISKSLKKWAVPGPGRHLWDRQANHHHRTTHRRNKCSKCWPILRLPRSLIQNPKNQEIFSYLFPYKRERPSKNVHKIGQPIRMRRTVELADVHHVVFVLTQFLFFRNYF